MLSAPGLGPDQHLLRADVEASKQCWEVLWYVETSLNSFKLCLNIFTTFLLFLKCWEVIETEYGLNISQHSLNMINKWWDKCCNRLIGFRWKIYFLNSLIRLIIQTMLWISDLTADIFTIVFLCLLLSLIRYFEFRQKYSNTRRMFNSLLGVWKSDETLSLSWEEIMVYWTPACSIYYFVSSETIWSPINVRSWLCETSSVCI